MICPECRTELDSEAVACPGCGARLAELEGSDWRRQVRETVARHKERRKEEEERRRVAALQLSIFPEPAVEHVENDPERESRLRRAEIRARVQDRMAKRGASARNIGRIVDAGEVQLASTRAVTARKLSREPGLEPLQTAEVHSLLEPLAEPKASDFDLPLARPDIEEARESRAADVVASGAERVISGAIDLTFVALIQLTLFYLTTHLVAQRLGALPQSALVSMSLVGLVMAAGYFLFFWSLSGQTLGKLLTGSRVVDRRGGALGFSRAVLRLVAVLLSALPLGAGFIGLWSHPERRGWHDRIAGTKVIRG